MEPLTLLAALASGVLIEIALGLFGGGGSILATPLLLYGVGIGGVHAAIGTGAVGVAANALAGLVNHARSGHVKWRCALLFAACGIAGAYGGAQLGKLTPPGPLLLAFAGFMALVGLLMLLPARPAAAAESITLTPARALRLAPMGLAVGTASGFFGIGGGFLIVPGLMKAGGLPMLNAVASSLVAVFAFGATTAASYAAAGEVQWPIGAAMIAGGAAGAVAGSAAARHLSRHKALLQRTFALVVLAAAAYVSWRALVD